MGDVCLPIPLTLPGTQLMPERVNIDSSRDLDDRSLVGDPEILAGPDPQATTRVSGTW